MIPSGPGGFMLEGLLVVSWADGREVKVYFGSRKYNVWKPFQVVGDKLGCR